MTLRRVLARVSALFQKPKLDRELEDEILAHIELAERDALAGGMTPAEARNEARRAFGGIEQMKEEHRERRGIRPVETLLRDIRYGLASLRNDPGFALVAIGVLALGIGANTAMFSLVDAIFLKPLPFPHPERIVRVWESPGGTGINGVNTLDLIDWKRMNTVFEALSAERPATAAMTGAGEPVRLQLKLVSSDYFRAFAVDPLLGRSFRPEEDQPGASPTIVISNATWKARFGADPQVLDHPVMLDGEPHKIVGVLPPGAFDRDETNAWKALVFKPEQMNRGFHWLGTVGRLKPGVSLEQAQTEMAAIDEKLTDLSPTWKRDWGVAVEPFDKRLIRDSLRRSIYVAFGAVALVLLIACANVANLLLAKGLSRKKEMALRAALGAGRGRLMGQLLTETLVLSVLGTVAGIGVAYLLVLASTPLLASSLPFTADIRLDLRVLGFAATIALAVSLLVGLLPSIQSSFGNLSQMINQSARGSSGSRDGIRRTIVAAEVAISLILICGAALLFKSLSNLQLVDTGVRLSNIVTTSVDLPLAAYPSAEKATLFFETVVERMRAIPGVEQAALTTDLPLQGVRQGEGIGIPGREGGFTLRYKRVDAGYFRSLDIPILAGRAIGALDREGAPRVAVINQTLATKLGEQLELNDPVGKLVNLSSPNYLNSNGEMKATEIIGVIRNERTGPLDEDEEAVVYVPLAQVPRQEVKLVLRTQIPPASVLPSVRAAMREIDPALALGDVRTMDEIRERTLTGAKQPAWVIGAFGAVAAFLAALGIYGIVSHSVRQRRREIGIRMALGARSRDVLSHVLRGALWMVGIGLVGGLVGAFAVTRVMESLLFEVSAVDPLSFVTACVAVLLVGFIATLLPVSRATGVEPVSVLRDEG